MYEIFLKLLSEKNVTAYQVGKATGIAGSTFSDWKSGRSEPKTDKLQKIADYFGVTLDYFTNGEEKEDFSSESAHLVSQIRKDTELSKALPKYFELSAEKKKHVIDLIYLLNGETV